MFIDSVYETGAIPFLRPTDLTTLLLETALMHLLKYKSMLSSALKLNYFQNVPNAGKS
jgi:hypothetical protein